MFWSASMARQLMFLMSRSSLYPQSIYWNCLASPGVRGGGHRLISNQIKMTCQNNSPFKSPGIPFLFVLFPYRDASRCRCREGEENGESESDPRSNHDDRFGEIFSGCGSHLILSIIDHIWCPLLSSVAEVAFVCFHRPRLSTHRRVDTPGRCFAIKVPTTGVEPH